MKTNFFLLLSAAVFLSACGNTKSPKVLNATENASLETPDNDVVSGKAYAYCNHTDSANSTFKLALHSYVESGVARNDRMYGMLTKIPANFKTSGERFRFFRWKIGNNNQAVVDPTPLAFNLINPKTGDVLLTAVNSITWADVSKAAEEMYITAPKDFFRRAFFLLNLADPLAEYQGVILASYKGSETAADQVNSLLPIFDVDVNSYKSPSSGETRPDALVNLHPYKADLGQSLSLEFNKSRVAELCAPWSDGL